MAVTSWATLGIADLGPFLRPFGNKSHIYSFIIFDRWWVCWCVDTGRILIIVNGFRHFSPSVIITVSVNLLQ